MFGYVTPDQSQLTPEQQQRYQAAYCGLCRAIGDRHGQSARLSLTYDMTFLVLLLESLYEPEQQQGKGRCAPHPVHPKAWSRSEVTNYAADMNVALSYYKCLDDWTDDRNLPKFAYAKLLERQYHEVKVRWSRQCEAIEQALDALSALEAGKSPDLDGCCRCFGGLMAELFVMKEDHWSHELRLFGDKLGQFIYLMDAVLDRQQDEKRGRYNPVSSFEAEYGSFPPFPVLTMLIGDSSLAFERLPLEQDLPLLRNILYSGVWIRYANAQKKLSPDKEEPSQ